MPDKLPVHIIQEKDGQLTISRIKSPYFTARYNNATKELEDAVFEQKISNQESYLNKAKAFIRFYLLEKK